MLTEIIEKRDSFTEIKSKLLKTGQIIHGLTNPAKSVMLSSLAAVTKSPIVFITQNHHEAANFYRELKNLNPQKKVFNFLSHEVSAYDQINSDSSIIASQFEVFESWQKQEQSITVVNFKALAQQFINYETFLGRKITIDAKRKLIHKN
jgi:transcription-repair coupling factor (superfamily II helicase)